MGLLDNKLVENYIQGNISIKEIHKLLVEKLGSKYKVTLVDKKNMAGRLVGGSAIDAVLIEKNAYHRTFVYGTFVPQSVSTSTDETFLYFDGATLKWWLSAINKNFGFVGSLIIRLIYGSSDAFDADILNAIKSKHTIKQREINAGISSIWKKDRVKEVS